MEAHGDTAYIVHPSQLQGMPISRPIAFVDNVEADRMSFRTLLGRMESMGITRAVVVTPLPADDYAFRAEMALTSEDVAVVRQNLERLGHPTLDASWANLWQGLLRAVKGE